MTIERARSPRVTVVTGQIPRQGLQAESTAPLISAKSVPVILST